jgi:hypothetical protein
VLGIRRRSSVRTRVIPAAIRLDLLACPLKIIHPYAEVMYADKIFAPFITGVVLVAKLQECEVDHTVGQPGCDDRLGNALEPKKAG